MLQEFTDIRQASIAAVKHIINVARFAVLDKGFCTIVLAGGSTPQQTYELLSEPENAEQMPWQQSHFFWGDERWVASKHEDSNFAMAHKSFLSRVNIPPLNIHQIPTGHKSAQFDAQAYEEHLRDFFSMKPQKKKYGGVKDVTLPSFDLIILGMGTDGHTASLFPGSNILAEKQQWVAAVPEGIGSPPVARITLTLPVLNQANNILFLIAGSKKRGILDTILTRRGEAELLYPAALIKPAGNLVWIVAEKG